MERGYDEGVVTKSGYASPVDCWHIKGDFLIGSPAHYHDYAEILYGINCNITVWINDELFKFESGDIIVINPGETHALFPDANDIEYFVIKFSPSVLRFPNQTPSEAKYLMPFICGIPWGSHIIKKNEIDGNKITRLIEEIYNEWVEEKFGYELAVRSGILKLFLQLIRYWQENDKGIKFSAETDKYAQSIFEVASYCEKNFVDVTEEELAKRCSLSYGHFSRTFKKVMGCNFSTYLNDIRIENAKRMLLTTTESITTIAFDTGFSSTSHFAYTFRKKTGVSPLKYKNEFTKITQELK